MSGSNLADMCFEDLMQEAIFDSKNKGKQNPLEEQEIKPKLRWYLIDSESDNCKRWNMMISLIIIHQLIFVPYIVQFPNFYESCLYTHSNGTKSLLKGDDTKPCVPTTN